MARKRDTGQRGESAQVEVCFEASLPPIQSAISVAGDGGARIKLDVPETDMDAVMRLAALRGQVLRVSIRPG